MTLALAVAVLGGVHFTQIALSGIAVAPTDSLGFRWLGGLLAFAFAGRVLLSFFPAGHLGSFRPRALATTWATSHLLGVGALGFTNVLLCTAPGAVLVNWIGRPAALLAPWIVLLGIRRISSPGAIVPQHQWARERLVGWTRSLPFVFLLSALYLLRAVQIAPRTAAVDLRGTYLGGAVSAFFDHTQMISPSFAWASYVATALLVVHGLNSARRSPATSWLLGSALLVTPLASECIAQAREELVSALLLTGGAVFGIAWLRRADRRSRAIAMFALLSSILCSWSGWLLAASAIAPLLLCTHKNSRRSFAVTAGALWLFIAWPIAGRVTHQIGVVEPYWVTTNLWSRVQLWFSAEPFSFLLPVLAIGFLFGLSTYRRRIPHPAEAAPIPPTRELIFLLSLFVFATMALHRGFIWLPTGMAEAEAGRYWTKLTGLITLPIAALVTGLANR